MYQALYRKYRPQTFSDVVGQEHIVRTLKNQITENRLSHAYLFTGSRGTGKTSCAKILAKAVNCLSPVDGDPCNECEICRGISDDTVMDITEIDAASNNRVDDIRELRENTAFTPVSAKYRVYIIDEVHMLSGAAFNALLKTLEEPPQHVIFILATTEVHKLPATILSRCQRFDFHRIAPDDIADRLMLVADKEHFLLEREAAVLISKLSDGAMRDAYSLLDVCAAATDSITEQTVLDCAGLSGREHLTALAQNIADGDCTAALDTIGRLYTLSKDMQRLCYEMIGHMRNVMLMKTVHKPERLIICPQAELDALRGVADKLNMSTVLHAIDLFEEAYAKMNRGADRRTSLETVFIRLCNPSLDTSTEALLRRIEALESGAALSPTASVTPPAHQPTAKAADAPAPDNAPQAVPPVPPENTAVQQPAPPAPPVPDSGSAVPFDRWADVLDLLSKSDAMLRAVLTGSEAYICDGKMLIDVKNAAFRDMVNNDQRKRAALKAAIAQVTGHAYAIGPYNAQSTAAVDPLDELIGIARQNGFDN